MARRNSNATKGRQAPRNGWSEKAWGRRARYLNDQDASGLDLEALARQMGVRYK